MATLQIRDESTAGKTLRITTIELPTEEVTVEELIRSYVFQGVKDWNCRRAAEAAPVHLIELTPDEIILNGDKTTKSDSIDWQAEFEKTKQAFRQRRILIFVNEQQVNSLDAVVTIRPSTDVRFLCLTLLMGG